MRSAVAPTTTARTKSPAEAATLRTPRIRNPAGGKGECRAMTLPFRDESPLSPRARTSPGAHVTTGSANVELTPRFSDAVRCLSATRSAVQIPPSPPEDNSRNPKRAWGFHTSVRCRAMGHRLTPRRTPATLNERWSCGLRARQTPYKGTSGRCRLHDRGAPDWGDRSRCSAAAPRRRRELVKCSAGTLLCDAHGEIATVEVRAIERGDRGAGAFLRLHLYEAETS